MKRTIAIVLAVLLMLGAMAACQNNGGNNGGTAGGAEGTYVLKSILGMDVATYASMLGIDAAEVENMFKLELKSGGKAVFTSDGDSVEADWSQNGSKIVLTVEGQTLMEATLNGNDLTAQSEGVEMVLTKK